MNNLENLKLNEKKYSNYFYDKFKKLKYISVVLENNFFNVKFLKYNTEKYLKKI